MMFLLEKIKGDLFFRRCAIYFTGSMLVAFLNYIFHPVLGRLLTPSDFGDVQFFVSLIAQSGIIFGAFSIVVVNITTNTESVHERNAILAELQKICLYFVCAVVIILGFFMSKLNLFFNLYSIYPIAGVIVLLILGIWTTFRNAYIQGSGKFIELSISGIISSSGRIVFAVLFILLGMRSLGAIFGVILAQIVVLWFLFIRTRNSLDLSSNTNIHVLRKSIIKKEIVYGILVLCASGLVTFMYTSDVLIVKHLFNSHEAGLYSGISAIAKIIFFLLSPTAVVLLSSVKIKNTEKENSIVLLKSLGISLCLGGVGLLVFLFFSDITIGILLGEKYLQFAYMLPKVGVVMFLASIVNIFVYYFLALRRFFLVWLSFIGISSIFLLLFINHDSMDSILNDLIMSLLILITFFSFIYAKNHFNRHSGL